MLHRSLWAVVLSLFLCDVSVPQIQQFVEAPQFAVGASPMAAASGDFNGDGIPDLVVTNKVDANISVLMGNGDGTFQPQVVYSVPDIPFAVAVGNFRGQSKYPDIAVTLPNSEGINQTNLVAIFFNKGDGTFPSSPSLLLQTGMQPEGIAVADLNGDGLPDIVVADSGASNVSVILNSGGGPAPYVLYPVGVAPWGVTIGDFNGDGIPDLAVTNQCGNDPTCNGSSRGSVSILLGVGDGTFGPQTSYIVGYQPMPIVAADFNGDHKLDLAVGNFNGTNVSILVGNGNGTFQLPVTYDTGPWEPYGLLAADFNGDGRMDLAASNAGSDSVSILMGKGDATFLPHVDYWAGNGAGVAAAADFNGDHTIDLAVPDLGWADRPDNKLTLLIGNGDGSFRSHVLYQTPLPPTAVAWGDFNGDGILDLAVTEQGMSDNDQPFGAASLFLGNGDGTYNAQPRFGTGTNYASAVAVGDFNGDGALDMAFADSGDNLVGILWGDGQGNFGENPTIISVGKNPAAIATGDFNKDGKLDLVVSNSGDSTVEVLLNTGGGSFQPQTPAAVGKNPVAIAVADVNHDGKLDVATANADDNNVSVLLGTGDGNFQPSSETFAVGSNPSGITAADFGNGVIGLAVTNQGVESDDPKCQVPGSYTMSVLLGNGDGSFQNQATYPTGCSPTAITSGDFNGDGKMDLFVANRRANTASLFYGNGDGTFQGSVESPAPTFGIGWQASALATVDLNQDGALDVLSVNPSVSSISVILNSQGTKIAFNSSAQNTTYGEPVTLTATVTHSISWEPDPTGQVSFLDGNSELGTSSLNGGTAQLTTSELTAGTHTLAAQYLGDSNFQRHTSASVTVNVSQASTTTTLTSSPNPSLFGQAVTFTATVSGQSSETPTGAVKFLDNTILLGSAPIVNGVATYITSSLSVGTHPITANYDGDSNFTGSSSPQLSQEVEGIPDFTIDGPAFTTPSVLAPGQSGGATIELTALSGFTDSVSLSCSGLPAGTSCSFNPSQLVPSSEGNTSQLTLNTSTNTPAGNYMFSVVGTSGSLIHKYSISFSIGDFKLTMPGTASPDSVLPGGSATATITVYAMDGFADSVALSCSGLPSGASCTFKPASVVPTNDGVPSTLTITSGTKTPLGMYTLSITGTSQTIAHTYSTLSFGVGGFETTHPTSMSPSSVTAGQSATATITFKAMGGFTSKLSLSCSVSPSPSGAPTCSMNPASLTPSASGTLSTLTVHTTARTTAMTLPSGNPAKHLFYVMWLPFLGVVLFGVELSSEKVRRRQLGCMLALVLVAMLFAVGCGGGSSTSGGGGTTGTPAGNYTITVTATAGSGASAYTQTVNLPVTVN